MIQSIYTFFISMLSWGLAIRGLYDERIKEWNEKRSLDINILSKTKRRAWIHCASLGEYYQAAPYIRQLLVKDIECIVTFFSPSGYNNINKARAHTYYYLPLDTPDVMHAFVDKIDPDVFIGVKYEMWWNMLSYLNKKRIPIFYTNVFFSKAPYYLKISSFKRIINNFTFLGCLSEKTCKVLNQYGITTPTRIQLDSRMVDVRERATSNKIELIETPYMVWGSIHLYELKYILPTIKLLNDLHHVIVPHDVNNSNLSLISSVLKKHGLVDCENIRLEGSMGRLFSYYEKASLAYVGGGFKNKLHNIFEPASFNVPVVYGNNIDRYPEGQLLKDYGQGYPVKDEKELQTIFLKLTNDLSTERKPNSNDLYEKAKREIHELVDQIIDVTN